MSVEPAPPRHVMHDELAAIVGSHEGIGAAHRCYLVEDLNDGLGVEATIHDDSWHSRG